MIIDEATVASYRQDGAVLIPGAFRDWTDSLSDACLSVLEEQRAGRIDSSDSISAHQNPLTVVEGFGGGAMMLNLVPYHVDFAGWLEASPAAELTAKVMQSSTSRFWVDASFLKDEADASEGTPWHNDTCTWPFWGSQMTILWIALTDVDKGNGPLTTVAGSHRGTGRYYSPFFPPTDALPEPYQPWQDLLDQVEAPDARIQTWTMKRGDCLCVHPSTIHGSLPRKGGATPRLAFSSRWLGDDVVWKPDPLTERMTARLNDHPEMRRGEPPPASVMPIQWGAG